MNNAILEIRELRAGYGRRTVLENISIALAAGEWFVLLGPNGCGKTTLLDCVVSRLIAVRGRDLASPDIHCAKLLSRPSGSSVTAARPKFCRRC